MNLPLDLALHDEPDIEIQHQEPLPMAISHSIVQTMSDKNLLLLSLCYCSLLTLLLLSLFTQIPNGQRIINIYFSYIIH